MMKLKDTITFKTLRDKGPSALDIKGEEVVQIISKGSEIKAIISQKFLIELLGYKNKIQQLEYSENFSGLNKNKQEEIDKQASVDGSVSICEKEFPTDTKN